MRPRSPIHGEDRTRPPPVPNPQRNAVRGDFRRLSTTADQGAQYLVYCDELTGLYNRRFYNRTYPELVAQARGDGSSLAVIMIDVDFFKGINDRYGHHQGDEILAGVGKCLNETVGMAGYPVRYAGDEFNVLLPGSDPEQAQALAEALAQNIRSTPFPAPNGQTLKVTFSVGVAHYPADVDDPAHVFECADKAAYMAKKNGRDQVVRYEARATRILDASALSNYFPCPTLVARDRVLKPLVDLLLAPTDTPEPWTVLSGPPGSGKTRILHEISARADRQRRVLIEAAGLPNRVPQPFSYIMDAVASHLHRTPTAGQQMATALTAGEIEAVGRLLPDLARHAMLATATGDGESDLHTAICKMLLALSKGRAPSFLLDDFHQADQDSLRVLERLREMQPLTFVAMAVRDDPDTRDKHVLVTEFIERLGRERHLTVTPIQPLSERETADLVNAILPDAQPLRHLHRLVHARSHGLPLLVEEVLKLLIVRGSLRYQDASLVVDAVTEQDIPTDPDSILALRAHHIEEEIREVMARAAVLGTEFTADDVRRLTRGEEGHVVGILERARRLHIITETVAGDTSRFAFVSPHTQAAFYQALDEAERRRLHLAIAREREAEAAVRLERSLSDLSFHYMRGGDAERAKQYREVVTALFSRFQSAGDADEDLRDYEPDDTLLNLAAAAARAFNALRHKVRSYGFDYVLKRGAFDEALQAFASLHEHVDAVTFTQAERRTLVNGVPLPPDLQYGAELIDFKAYELQSLTFKRPLAPEDMRAFVEAVTLSRDDLRGRGGLSRVLAGHPSVVPNERIYVAVGDRDILLKRVDTGREVLIKEVEAAPAEAPRERRRSASDEEARWHRELGKYVDFKLLDALARDPDVLRQDLESGDTVRIAAASRVCAASPHEATGPLLRVVATTSDTRARALAVGLLRKSGADPARHLQEALHASGDTAEQARLIAGLGESRDPGLAPHLEPFVRHEDRDVRRETVRALAAISRTSLEHTLLTALEAPSDEVRADAAAAIGERGVFMAVPALLNLIRKTSVLAAEPSEPVQARACQALGQLKEQGAVPALLAALARGAVGMRTKPPLVRSAAAMALSQLADGPQRDPIARALEQACEDDEGVVRAAALVAMGRVTRST